MKKPEARIITGVLIVSLLCPPAGLSASERRGYDLVVTRLDGSHALGELLAVRPESLLLLAGMKELTVSRSDIMSVRIVRPSKAGLFAGILAVPGVAFAALMAFSLGESGREKASGLALGSLVFGGGGAAVGALLGSAMGKDTTFKIAGEPEDLVAHYWAELPRYSRERRLPVLVVTPEPMPRVTPPAAPKPAVTPPIAPPAAVPAPRRRGRFSVSLGGTFGSRASPGTASGEGSFRFPEGALPGETAAHPFNISRQYPRRHQGGAIVGPLRLIYEWKKHLSAEVELFTSGQWLNDFAGSMTFTSSADGKEYRSEFFGSLETSFSGVLAGLAWRPISPTLFRRHVIEVGAAVGPAFAKIHQRSSVDQDFALSDLRKVALSARVHAGYDFYFVPYLSIGAFVGYRRLQANYPGSTISAEFWFTEVGNWTNYFSRTTEVTFPGFPVKASSTFWGLRAGFRF